MKQWYSISKILLLVLLVFGTGQVAKAQSVDEVFNQIGAAIRTGNADAVAPYLNVTVELTVPGSDQSYSANQAVFVLKDFFKKYPPKGFQIAHKGSSGATWYATGSYASASGSFDTNIFVKKIGEKFLATQLRFEAD